ncbi:MAG: hypothetical protein H6573_22115 [Lewinellaceae bacterium]|nr:hypothetical protein [Lewinellaceae bacterium]
MPLPWKVHTGKSARAVVGAGSNKYLYNGKELSADYEINLYEYGAQWYGPAIGRWTSVDPLAEKTPNESPYNYVGNDPIRNIDVGGKYKLPAAFVQKYPNFARYLQNNVRNDVMNSTSILQAFSNNTAADSPSGVGNLEYVWRPGLMARRVNYLMR